MRIEKINIQNFYSFKDVSLNLADYSGLTVIKGKNQDTGGSNGSGKSALVEAIYFGLTGKTIRKSTEDSLVNNQAKKKCVVEVHLTHENNYIVISRQKKPTKLEFLVGEENKTQASVADTQKEIDSYLNINHKVLLASMFFGQSNDVNFLDCTAEDKRTIIRNFLNLDDIFAMRDKIKSHKSTFYQGIKEKDAVIADNNKNIKKLDGKLADVVEAQKQYAEYDEETLNLSLEDILKAEEAERDLNFTLSAYRKEITTLEDVAESLQHVINHPLEPDLCPTCGAEQEVEVNVDEKKAELTNEVMRFWEKAFSEQGVIKHIINNVLDYFNERCNYYLSYLTNSKYSVEFDEELTEKIETNGRLLSYISLSGGEKRKLNLAVLLGLKDLLLLTDTSHVDLLFFDEVAENIDEEGIEGLHQLLLELKKSKTIFIITHNKYLKTLLDSSPRLSIIKHKGTSKIKE
jgi:DNA repair exonuclease SbcCD ATPase subunit